jgi:hypothetical protein
MKEDFINKGKKIRNLKRKKMTEISAKSQTL